MYKDTEKKDDIWKKMAGRVGITGEYILSVGKTYLSPTGYPCNTHVIGVI
jgi:hypothetical protein